MVPVAAAVVTLVACAVFGLTSSIGSTLLFTAAAFVLGTVVQEFWRGTGARRAMSGEPAPLALVSLVRRNRRRYGGYLVHLGIAVLFVGVAASSSFADERDVRLSPGDSVTVAGYELTYDRPTAELRAAPNGRLERIDFGADLRVTRDGRDRGTLVTEKSYFPSAGPML